MAKQNFIQQVLVALLVYLSQYCAQAEVYSEDDYLQLPHSSQFKDDFHLAVRNALINLEIKEDSNAETILNQLERGISLMDDNLYVQFERLDQLPPNNADYPDYVLRAIKSIVAQMNAGQDEHFGKIARAFLNNYVRPRLNLWKNWFEDAKVGHPFLNLVSTFDGFLVAALQLNTKKRAESEWKAELGHLLEDFDLATHSNLDVRKMLAVASVDFKNTKTWPRKEVLWPIEAFMNFNCNRMLNYQHVLEVLNFSKIVPDWKEFTLKPGFRLDNYHQICRAWRNPETRAKIVDNMRRQILH